MAASQAGLGYGSIFYMGTAASPLSYTASAEIASINFSGESIPSVQTTHLLSPNTTEEMIPGIIKPPSIALKGNFTGVASQLAVMTAAVARTIFSWKVTAILGTGQTLTMSGLGFINKDEIGPMEADKKIDFSFDIQCTGPVTYAVA